jgi:hypothetical protein
VKFAQNLLARNVYTVGTIQTNKAGFSPEVKAEIKSRPKDVPRGDTKMVVAKACPQLTVLRWLDRKPIHSPSLTSAVARFIVKCDSLRVQATS